MSSSSRSFHHQLTLKASTAMPDIWSLGSFSWRKDDVWCAWLQVAPEQQESVLASGCELWRIILELVGEPVTKTGGIVAEWWWTEEFGFIRPTLSLDSDLGKWITEDGETDERLSCVRQVWHLVVGIFGMSWYEIALAFSSSDVSSDVPRTDNWGLVRYAEVLSCLMRTGLLVAPLDSDCWVTSPLDEVGPLVEHEYDWAFCSLAILLALLLFFVLLLLFPLCASTSSFEVSSDAPKPLFATCSASCWRDIFH